MGMDEYTCRPLLSTPTFGAGMHYESKDTRAVTCHAQYKTCLESTCVSKSQDHTVPCRLQMVLTKVGSSPVLLARPSLQWVLALYMFLRGLGTPTLFLCANCLLVPDTRYRSCPLAIV